MEEWEALIQRRKVLTDKISKMDYEIEKINLRLDLLGKLLECVSLILFKFIDSWLGASRLHGF
jgi:hypothetical protein